MSSSVSGGAGGLTARHDDLLLLGRLYDEVGDDLRQAAARLGAVLAGLAQERELVVAAALSPGTAASAAGQAADAVATLVPLAVGSELQARFLQTAVSAYREADELLARAAQLRRDVLGYAVGLALPARAAGAAAVALGSEGLEETADAVGLDGLAGAIDRGQAATLDELQQLLLEHPDLLEDVVGGTGGLALGLTAWLPPGVRELVRGAPGFPTGLDEAVRDLSAFFADGEPVLGQGGPVREQDRRPPLDVAALLLGVDRRQRRPGSPQEQRHDDRFARPGEIGVKRVLGSDGVVRWIVELPGTEHWPLEAGEQLRDTATNVHTMAGRRTAYMRGVHDALAAAGVQAGQPVMLVGHSQGGMTAAALAADEQFRARFDVTHVVTAGSPVARTDVPRDVQVLALENGYDVVPRVDGLANRDLPNVTTVRQDDQQGSVGGNHALSGYAERARSLPDHPSVAAWQDSAQGFFDPGGTVEEHRNVTVSRRTAP